mmetsp:Transcript_9213/g.22957  ORF Transcript_9213/g.22957 Transcript_9213/m.22957 type:complete len:82 (-) Transcript_9213:79-324(-)
MIHGAMACQKRDLAAEKLPLWAVLRRCCPRKFLLAMSGRPFLPREVGSMLLEFGAMLPSMSALVSQPIAITMCQTRLKGNR